SRPLPPAHPPSPLPRRTHWRRPGRRVERSRGRSTPRGRRRSPPRPPSRPDPFSGTRRCISCGIFRMATRPKWGLGHRSEAGVASEMEGPSAGVPVVVLPERVDRRVRLGPFPSAKDAVKFASYAAAGAVLAPFATPFAWVPVLALGFVVSVWHPDGEA